MKRRTFLRAVTAGSLISAANSTKSMAALSANDQTRREVAWSRKVPVRWEADVAVIGGGIAGVSAACAAAEAGAKVVLVERFAICGGDLTSGGLPVSAGEWTAMARYSMRSLLT